MLAGLTRAAEGAPPGLPRLGDYLDVAYVQVLRTSGSPWRAGTADTRLRLPQVISVQADAAGRRVALNYGWGEGRLLLVMGRGGQMYREMAWSRAASLALRVARDGALCLAGQAAPREHCYRYVGDARRFVTQSTLAGRWRDRQGQAYWFSADGHAHFPGYDFSYALALDRGGLRYDCFEVETSGRVMAFRREGAAMALFALAAPGTAPDFRQPAAVLQREEDSSPFLKKRTKKLFY